MDDEENDATDIAASKAMRTPREPVARRAESTAATATSMTRRAPLPPSPDTREPPPRRRGKYAAVISLPPGGVNG